MKIAAAVRFRQQRVIGGRQDTAVGIDQFNHRVEPVSGAVDIKPDLGRAFGDEGIDVDVVARGDRTVDDETESAILVPRLFVGSQFTQELRLAGNRVGIEDRRAHRFLFGDRSDVSIIGSFADRDTIPKAVFNDWAKGLRNAGSAAMSSKERCHLRQRCVWIDIPGEGRGHIVRPVLCTKDRVGTRRQVDQIDIACQIEQCRCIVDHGFQLRINVRGPTHVGGVLLVDAVIEIESAVRESNASRRIDREGSEISFARRTGCDQDVVRHQFDIFVQVADDANITQGTAVLGLHCQR